MAINIKLRGSSIENYSYAFALKKGRSVHLCLGRLLTSMKKTPNFLPIETCIFLVII